MQAEKAQLFNPWALAMGKARSGWPRNGYVTLFFETKKAAWNVHQCATTITVKTFKIFYCNETPLF